MTHINDDNCEGVAVEPSQIEGQGLYARRSFVPGEIVLRWDISQLIDSETLDSLAPQQRKYTHRFDEHRYLIVQSPERYVNHSCDNNTTVRNFCDVAIRHISPGEEITSDYSSDGSGSTFHCRCRSENCRGIVR